MSKDDIRAMFWANAFLRRTSPADPRYKTCEVAYSRLEKEYDREFLASPSPEPAEMDTAGALEAVAWCVNEYLAILKISGENGTFTQHEVDCRTSKLTAALEKLQRDIANAS